MRWLAPIIGLVLASLTPAGAMNDAESARLRQFIDNFEQPGSYVWIGHWVRQTGPWARFARRPNLHTELCPDERAAEVDAERAGRCDAVAELETIAFKRRWPHMAPLFVPEHGRAEIISSFRRHFLAEISIPYRRCQIWHDLPEMIRVARDRPQRLPTWPKLSRINRMSDYFGDVWSYKPDLATRLGQLAEIALCTAYEDAISDVLELHHRQRVLDLTPAETLYLETAARHLGLAIEMPVDRAKQSWDDLPVVYQHEIWNAGEALDPTLAGNALGAWAGICAPRVVRHAKMTRGNKIVARPPQTQNRQTEHFQLLGQLGRSRQRAREATGIS